MSRDTGSFIGFIIRQSFSLILVITVCVALAIFYLRTSTYEYKVAMEVAAFSMEDPNVQGTSLPGASILGLKDENTSLTPYGLYLRHLTSYRTAEKLYEDESLLKRLFPLRWNADQGVWVKPKGPLVAAEKTLAEFVGYPDVIQPKPSIDALWNVINDKIQREEIDESLQRIWLYAEDPQVGVELLNKLHKIADDNARDFLEKSSVERLNLLEERYDQAPIKQVRLNLVNLMMHYQRVLIMTDGGDNFAAEQFQIPVADVDPSTPSPKLTLAVSVAIGLILFIFLALLQERRTTPSRGRST